MITLRSSRPGRERSAVWVAALCGLVLAGAGGCSRPGGPFEVTRSEFPIPDAGTPPVAVTAPPQICTPAQSSTMIPPCAA